MGTSTISICGAQESVKLDEANKTSAGLVYSLEKNLNNLNDYNALKTSCLKNFEKLKVLIKRPQATSTNKLLYALALFYKAQNNSVDFQQKMSFLNTAGEIIGHLSDQSCQKVITLFKGLIEFEKGKWAEAEKHLSKLKMHSAMANYYQMLIQITKGNYAEALKYANMLPNELLGTVAATKILPNVGLYRAHIYMQISAGKSSLSDLAEMEMSMPGSDNNSIIYSVLQIDFARNNGNLFREEELLNGLIDKYPNLPEAHFRLGMFYSRMTEHEKAYPCLEKAIKLAEANIDPIQKEYGEKAKAEIQNIKKMNEILYPKINDVDGKK